jgi:competence ComEA-like helix-hairpin-helix protein
VYKRQDVNKAALIEIERLPGVGFRRAQALVEYRQQQGPLESIEQLSEVEGFDPELIDELTPYLQVATPPLKQADIQGEISVDMLIQARAAIYKDDIDAALENYQSLIQQKMSLPEVVKDLEEALYTHPVDVSIWTTLGDAQMRAGQLHKAMDSYSKAEELLA